MDLSKVNEMSLLAFKPTIPLRNLKIDEKYRILGIKKITGGKYGDSLIAELEEVRRIQTFLPKRLIPSLNRPLGRLRYQAVLLSQSRSEGIRSSNIRPLIERLLLD
ncbi:hypothetical protein NQ315_015268 [Exocentrus adspersus]|uniref:Uncharacterized protein n=1 Tax=Exocentrus adspersus TaxID=1586481 RepID=A0AAV8VAT4_9CUCU|nr:hypothetical protein NQ315_015268 [Exocentrus adspersus]